MATDDYCLSPELCPILAERKQREWEKIYPEVLELQEYFLRHPRHAIFASYHGIKRMKERSYDPRDVRAIIECCEPIYYDFKYVPYYRPREVHRMIFNGECADGRPLHVVCTLPPDPPPEPSRWIMRIRSVYDPSERAFEWTRDYASRICFCYGAASRELDLLEEELDNA